MQQVKDSPDIATDRPVSRQMETNIYDYYGWAPYWGAGLYMGGFGYVGGAMAMPSSLGSMRREEEIADTLRNDEDPHLRSIGTVSGYRIHASDGRSATSSIHYLVVDTKNWWPGKKVLISPRSAREINWTDRLVNLKVDRQRVKNSPPYDASTTVDGAYEKHFHSYYGDVRATDQP